MDRRILTSMAAGGQYHGFQATCENAGEFLRNRRDEAGAFFRYRCISLVDAFGSGARLRAAAFRYTAVPRTGLCSRRL